MLGRKPATAGAIFGQLCLSRAGLKSVDSVHDSRRVIEVSQQFTTHNLAILLDAGVHPQTPWFELALSAGQTTAELLLRVPRSPNPQTTLRNAGYAWRQALFFLKCAGEERAPEFMTRLQASESASDWPLSEVLDGLNFVVHRGRFAPTDSAASFRRLEGWSSHPHGAIGSASPPHT